MAVFRKFLSATKSKIKSTSVKIEGHAVDEDSRNDGVDQEFEVRKQEWQEELDQMSEFLVIKSTEEQREEGVENPVDTAFIDDKDGLPVLKAFFDVQHFKPDEVQLNVENGMLTVFAQCLEEKDVAVFKKTMIRRLEIPHYVDHKMMHCVLSSDKKILMVEMPFHLPPQKRPIGPTVVPVLSDEGGNRKIRLVFMVGSDFAQDDVVVSLDENKPQCLTVEASYEAEIGLYGLQVTRHQFRKRFRLPEFLNVDKVEHSLSEDGELFVDILLKDDLGYKFKVIAEKLIDGINDINNENDQSSPSVIEMSGENPRVQKPEDKIIDLNNSSVENNIVNEPITVTIETTPANTIASIDNVNDDAPFDIKNVNHDKTVDVDVDTNTETQIINYTIDTATTNVYNECYLVNNDNDDIANDQLTERIELTKL